MIATTVWSERLTEEIRRVEAIFDDEIRCDLPFVEELTRRIRAFRGKMLRPKLVLWSGQATGRLREEHCVLAAVVEMIHMATLVHDDVLDEAGVRRRSPTVNRLIGNEGAVLLGDYLISHAYHLCGSLGSTRISRRIASVTNTVCEGELMQIAHRGDWTLDEPTYLEIIRRKTASLTSVCCELGAELTGASSDTVRRMANFGMHLGVAFQIIDDLLDLVGTQEETGKTVGRDAEMGKLTLPAIRLLRTAEATVRERFLSALNVEAADRVEVMRRMLSSSDAVDYSRGVARRHISQAIDQIAPLPAGEAKEALTAAAEFILQRRE